MKAGKALNERKVEIRVQYKPPAASIHGENINEMRNELVVSTSGGDVKPVRCFDCMHHDLYRVSSTYVQL